MFQAVKFWWKMDTSWRRPKFFEWVVKNHHLVISTFVPSPWAWEHQTVPNRKPTNFGFLLQLGETRSECSLKQQKNAWSKWPGKLAIYFGVWGFKKDVVCFFFPFQTVTELVTRMMIWINPQGMNIDMKFLKNVIPQGFWFFLIGEGTSLCFMIFVNEKTSATSRNLQGSQKSDSWDSWIAYVFFCVAGW